MSILKKLDVMVTTDREPRPVWMVHADLIRAIIRHFKFEPIDATNKVRIENLIFKTFTDVHLVWDVSRTTTGTQNWLIVSGTPFEDRTIHFLL